MADTVPTTADIVKSVVGRRVQDLQRRFINGSPTAVAEMARLRRGVGRPAGSLPDIWDLTIDGIVGDVDAGPPTPAETAAHVAMCLYALHQRGNQQPMHIERVNLGQAVARLRPVGTADDTVSGEGLTRRIAALVTATDIAESEYHLRGLVTLLSGAGIAFDYGRLARDLYRLQHAGSAEGIRLRWARSYYGRATSDARSGTKSAPDSSTTDSAEEAP